MRASLREALVEDEELESLARYESWGGNQKALEKQKALPEPSGATEKPATGCGTRRLKKELLGMLRVSFCWQLLFSQLISKFRIAAPTPHRLRLTFLRVRELRIPGLRDGGIAMGLSLTAQWSPIRCGADVQELPRLVIFGLFLTRVAFHLAYIL